MTFRGWRPGTFHVGTVRNRLQMAPAWTVSLMTQEDRPDCPERPSTEIFLRRLCHQLRQEGAEDKHREATDKNQDGLAAATLPLLEDDSPDIGEGHVESHEYAPAEGDEHGEVGQEALSEAEPEELAVPEQAGEGAEHDVVAPERTLPVVGEGLVLRILVETVDRVGDETSYGHEEGGGQSREDLPGLGPAQRGAEVESDVEACAHEAAEQGDDHALAEVEVLDGLLLLLLGQRGGFHAAGDADDRDSDESHHDADPYGSGQSVSLAREQRAEDRAETRAGAEGDALAESHSEIPHRKSEGQAPDAPEDTEDHGQQAFLGILGVDLEQAVA